MGPRRGRRAALLLFGFALALPAGGGELPRERVLVMLLDAVPYGVVARATDPGRGEAALFPGFPPPLPVIATFPATTNVAITGLLEPFGIKTAPGYEVRFFDRAANRLRGGGPLSYHRIDFPWRSFFDFAPRNLRRGMVGKLRPVATSLQEVDEALESFEASPAEVFFAYIEGTDGAGHLGGPEASLPVLAALDLRLRELRQRLAERGERLVTVLLSDHGMAGGEVLDNVRGPARERLRDAGFLPSRQLNGGPQVVFADLGMVGSFPVYTAAGREGEVAAVLAGTPGVDLCAHPADGGVRVVSRRGEAWIGSRKGEGGEHLLAYGLARGSGDPLGYAPVLACLRERAGEPEQRWFPQRWWLEASLGSLYPDALYRLLHAFAAVDNPASILCSTGPAHLYSARRTELASRLGGIRLAWTHGSLDRDSSLGFLLTDAPGWPRPLALRFDQALAPLADRVRAAAGRAAGPGES